MLALKSCHPTHRPHMATYVYNCSGESYCIDQCDRPIIQVLVDLCSWVCAHTCSRTQLDEDIVCSLITLRNRLASPSLAQHDGETTADMNERSYACYFQSDIFDMNSEPKQLRDTKPKLVFKIPPRINYLLSSQLSVHCFHLPLCVLVDTIPPYKSSC